MANTYCTTSQFFAYFDRRTALQLSGDDNSRAGDLDTLQTLLDTSAAEIDTYLTGRVTLPIVTVPLMLTKLTADRAAGMLFERRAGMPDSMKAAADRATKWLEDFAAGRVNLTGVTRPVPVVEATDRTDGSSRFSLVMGQRPSTTSADSAALG